MVDVGNSVPRVFERMVGGTLTYILDIPLGPGDTDEAAYRILKTVNRIAATTSPVTKQASATIGGAMLDLAEKQDQAQPPISSPGVRYYERVEDVEDPDLRRMFEGVLRWKEQFEAEMRVKPDIYNMPEHVRSGSNVLMRLMENYFGSDMSFTTGRPSNGRVLREYNEKALDFLGHFEANLAKAVAEINVDAIVARDIVIKGESGRYRYGTFEARDKTS